MGFEKIVRENKKLPVAAATGLPLIYLDRNLRVLRAPCATKSLKSASEQSEQRFELLHAGAAKCAECAAEIQGA